MHDAGATLPPGFIRYEHAGTEVVCVPELADGTRAMLAEGTLYRFAARQPGARSLSGRGPAYAIAVPGTTERAVVRHNRHGGLLAPVTGDLFRPPTRAPRELRISEQFLAHSVPTPKMLAYAVYRAPAGFRRVDVMTREVSAAFDLSEAIVSDDSSLRASALAAASDLVLALSAVGAHHVDLNVKNVLLHPASADAERLEAMVLDVDSVRFDEPEIVLDWNLDRLLRSARKWQRERGAKVTQAELDELAGSVRERRPPPRDDAETLS